jgi:hypothetical protein
MVGSFKPTIGESLSNPERWSAMPKVPGVIDSHETREPLAKFEKNLLLQVPQEALLRENAS